MDRRHLSIERASTSRHLAHGRSGLGHCSSGSKTSSPASVARTPRKNVRALETVARRRRPALLASLFEQARPAHFRDFALAGHLRAGHWRRQMSPIFSRRDFLALTGCALAAPSISWVASGEDGDDEDVPALLDHIILGCHDLDKGIELVQ